MNPKPIFANPFRPGAGHMPPYLAGRKVEKEEFRSLLHQEVVMKNFILTGLRGVGKTVLLEELKPIAQQEGWLWIGTDLSESASVNESNIAIRLLADLSVITSTMVIDSTRRASFGISPGSSKQQKVLDYAQLCALYEQTPGLIADKLKHVLDVAWQLLKSHSAQGLVFAYDEAQNLSDHAGKDQFPLSLILDIFQSLQRRGARIMLVLTGLPTLLQKLVEARTYSERMFHVVQLDKLDERDGTEAIRRPIEDDKNCPITFLPAAVKSIYRISGGYPYFIQFICREVFDIWLRDSNSSIPITEITRKLDTDFFAGRWGNATDRQRDLLATIAQLSTSDSEFTVQEIYSASRNKSKRPFSRSQISQMLSSLADVGLVYKNRHGKHSFAVPLLGRFILRQVRER